MQEQQLYNENFLKNQDLINQLVMNVDEDEYVESGSNSKDLSKIL